MSKVVARGQVVHISKEQVISDKFRKAELVVCISGGRYDDYIKFEVINDQIKALEKIKLLDEVTANGYLQGRKWTDAQGETRYMTSIRLLSIEPASNQVTSLAHDIEDAPF